MDITWRCIVFPVWWSRDPKQPTKMKIHFIFLFYPKQSSKMKVYFISFLFSFIIHLYLFLCLYFGVMDFLMDFFIIIYQHFFTWNIWFIFFFIFTIQFVTFEYTVFKKNLFSNVHHNVQSKFTWNCSTGKKMPRAFNLLGPKNIYIIQSVSWKSRDVFCD